MRQAEDIELVTPLGRRAGLHWRTENAPRVLCLHGWLDNAASFIPLAPLLDKLEVFALDFPGHGNSEHRHMTARYHFIDYLWDVDAVLNALQWEDCHLLGHSLGAAVSSVYCAGAPERVRSAVLLDTLGPISVSAQSSADRLRRSLHKNRMERRVPWCSAEKMKARKQAIAHGRHETVTGHHHFHMDEPEQIAETVQSFILASDKATDTRGQNDQTD